MPLDFVSLTGCVQMFGGHWCACVIVFRGHCVWGKCLVTICRCHMYRFQLTGLGWLLLLFSPRRSSNLLWPLRLTASRFLPMPPWDWTRSYLSWPFALFLYLLHPFSYPVFLMWVCGAAVGIWSLSYAKPMFCSAAFQPQVLWRSSLVFWRT